MKSNEEDKTNNIMSYIVVFIIIIIMIWLFISEYKDTKIENKNNIISEYNIQSIGTQYNKNNEINTNTNIDLKKEYQKEEIINQYKGYQVGAKLEIPKIALETYILQNYSVKALNISVTKFWGTNANEVGNFCIAGHNFQNKNMFHDLKKLNIGDTLFISDNKIGKVKYEIYDIYKVEPDDVSCLSQETNGKKEVTLITCTSDSEKRIIVKARESEM